MPTTRATRTRSGGVEAKKGGARESLAEMAMEESKSRAAARGGSAKTKTKAATRPRKTKAGAKAAVQDDSADEQSGDQDDRYTPDEDEDTDARSINSENLDDDDEFQSDSDDGKKRKRKRPSASPSKTATPSAKKTGAAKTKATKSTPRKKRKTAQNDDDDDADFDLELGEGQEIVGRVVRAPTTGRVPPGQISQNTLDFLTLLKRPECNDREWFKLNEPVYRLAETEWKAFIDSVTDVLVGADPQIPHLPPKDVVHRIYRDVRFSNDKTPYKTGFSANFSRSGRKGIFAGYHISIRPGDSLIAAGSWCPAKNELATIRNNLLRSSTRLRRVLAAPAFVGLFGEPSPDTAGGRCSIFGREDELKVAPKGVPKDHKDIDLLKCRSFAVMHQFTDKEVLQPGFKDELGRLVRILRPFVHCLNDLMTIQDADSSDDDDDGGDDDAASAAETGDENEDGADDDGAEDALGAPSEDED